MISSAMSVEAYIEALPTERREAFEKLLQVIRANIPPGFEMTLQYGMVSFVVPHRLYPAGYHCKPSDPLPFASIANQKQGIHFYHMGLYGRQDLLRWFQEEFSAHTARKPDMGKSCVRFRGGKDIPYALIGKLMQKISVQEYISMYEAARNK